MGESEPRRVRSGRPDGFVKKNPPKCSPTHFLSKVMPNFYCWKKVCQKISATSLFINKLPKVNKRPVAENFAKSGHPDSDAFFPAKCIFMWESMYCWVNGLAGQKITSDTWTNNNLTNEANFYVSLLFSFSEMGRTLFVRINFVLTKFCHLFRNICQIWM
jgi:hypothetical protein